MGSEGNLGSSGALRWSWNHQGMWGTPRALQILRWPWDPQGSWRDSRPIVETLMGTLIGQLGPSGVIGGTQVSLELQDVSTYQGMH